MTEIRQRIIYLREVMKLSFRQIEEQLGISRKRVSKIYRGNYTSKIKAGGSLLDKYRPLIANWFYDYPQLKACQVYDWLTERGLKISYPRVVQYTKEFRKKREKVYHPLDFLPGEEGQVDWAIINHARLGKLYCFVLILSYSRYLFAHLFARFSFEFFIQGHLMAFSYMNGLPYSLRYDNLRSVVLKRRPKIIYNPRFLDFCRHYGISIRLCNPGAGNEKGRVERAIRSLKETFFNCMDNYMSFEALNLGLDQWVEKKNKTIHRATQQRPIDLFKKERLRTLPEIPWNNVSIHPPVKTTKTGMIIFDTNSYSVPDYLVGKSLSIHASVEKINIYDRDKKVASHPRCFQRYSNIINPLHRKYLALSAKAKSQRIYEVIKNMHPSMADFLLKNQTYGEDPYKAAYQIFKLLKTHSLSMIISIVQECLKIKSPRIKTFLSYVHAEPIDDIDEVRPQNSELLNISYHPRTLEDYDESK